MAKKIFIEPKAEFKEIKAGEEPRESSANTRLPFGLCMKYGIPIQDSWAPRDAWDALKGKTGKSPEDFYERLEDEAKEKIDKKQPEIVFDKEIIKTALNNERFLPARKATKEAWEQNFEYANEEMKGVTANLFIEDHFKLGNPLGSRRTACYNNGENQVCISANDLSWNPNSIHSKGGTLYHEVWHAIDANYGGQRWTTLSASYQTSKGTVLDCVVRESNNLDIDGLKNEIEKDLNDYFEKQGINRQQIVEKYRTEKEKLLSGEQNQSGYFNAVQDYYKVGVMKSGEVMQKWSDLSDVVCGRLHNGVGLGFAGHLGRYFSDKSKRAEEAFAEIASAKATNPASYSILKKYLPDTVAAFEEIFTKLKRGEIKKNDVPKWW